MFSGLSFAVAVFSVPTVKVKVCVPLNGYCFSALIRKQHTAELHLGDFLVFLRRVVSSKAIQSKMASPKWTEVLLNIAAQKCCSGKTSLQNSDKIVCENIAVILTLLGS